MLDELHYPLVIKVTKMRKMEIRDNVGEASTSGTTRA